MTNPQKWEPGDVVQLNSGGPLMTVNEVDGRGITCVWIENGSLCEADAIDPRSVHSEPVEAFVGDYFLSLKKDETIEWHGQVLASIAGSSMYQIELFSWITGLPIERRIVSLDQMEGWLFYEDEEQLREAYRARNKS